MAIADLQLPTRLLAGGGPSTPDPRVLRALTTPVIGQFDPEFTAIMDDVVQLARQALLTANPRCFPISGLPSAGLETALNSLLEEGDEVAIGGGPGFVAATAEIARRLGLRITAVDQLSARTGLVVFPFIDPTTAVRADVRALAASCHQQGIPVLVEATHAVGAGELRVDDWSLDVCVAGVDFGLGAPSGMTLITYSPRIEARLATRQSPPRTSYLDLRQLQAYWSPERLNHHTAPTSLIYGLREALRLVREEGLEQRWARHMRYGQALREGLVTLRLDADGALPYSIVHLPESRKEEALRGALREEFGVQVTPVGPRTWRLGLLGADARPENVKRVLGALGEVLRAL
jgi:aspartate aminotransferase-like enzyme